MKAVETLFAFPPFFSMAAKNVSTHSIQMLLLPLRLLLG
jgi:hypothetical protein